MREGSRDSNLADREMTGAVGQGTNPLSDELQTRTNSTHWFNRQSATPSISAAWGSDPSQGRVAILATSAMWGALRAASIESTNFAIDREL
jgi:hypothetical protein